MILLVMHSIRHAQQLSDRLLYLDSVVPVEESKTAALLAAPRKKQAKRFLEFYGQT